MVVLVIGDRSWHDVISSRKAAFVLMEPEPKQKKWEVRLLFSDKRISAKIWPTMILSKRQIFMASHCFQTKWSPSCLVSKLFTVYASAFSPRLCVEPSSVWMVGEQPLVSAFYLWCLFLYFVCLFLKGWGTSRGRRGRTTQNIPTKGIVGPSPHLSFNLSLGIAPILSKRQTGWHAD